MDPPVNIAPCNAARLCMGDPLQWVAGWQCCSQGLALRWRQEVRDSEDGGLCLWVQATGLQALLRKELGELQARCLGRLRTG